MVCESIVYKSVVDNFVLMRYNRGTMFEDNRLTREVIDALREMWEENQIDKAYKLKK